MRIKQLEDLSIILTPILIVSFIFFLPLSPSFKSIFFGGSIALILLTPYYRKHLLFTYNTLWGQSAVALFTFIVIASLWSPASFFMQWSVIGKYCKLLYLPILAVGFINPKVRNWSINSYLAAVFITCVLSILKTKGFLEAGDPGEVFYNHIITGFMIAFGSYLAGLFVFQYQGWLRLFYLFLFLFTSFQVFFINTGRTGYIVYLILMLLLLLQKLPLKKAALGSIFFSAVLAIVYTQSTMMQNNIHSSIKEVKFFQENNKSTSLGYRIQFHHYAKSLFEQHPIIGIGTGGFKYQFEQDDPIPQWGKLLTDPHSQYWMILSEQGLIGFVLLLFFLGSLLFTSFQLTETRPILLGILISFCVGSLSDTILCYSAVGYLLAVMCALSFGELIERRVKDSLSNSDLVTKLKYVQ